MVSIHTQRQMLILIKRNEQLFKSNSGASGSYGDKDDVDNKVNNQMYRIVTKSHSLIRAFSIHCFI